MPTRFEVCKSDLRMDAVVIEIDEASGRSLSITRLSLGM
jgi:calcineurin-like phosphoesterase